MLILTGNTILSKVRSRAGDLFDPKTAAEDVKRIAEIPGIQQGWYNTKVVDGKVELDLCRRGAKYCAGNRVRRQQGFQKQHA